MERAQITKLGKYASKTYAAISFFELIVVAIIISFSALVVGAKTYEETTRFTQIMDVLDWAGHGIFCG